MVLPCSVFLGWKVRKLGRGWWGGFLEFLPKSSAEGAVGEGDLFFVGANGFREHPGGVPFAVPGAFGGFLGGEVAFCIILIGGCAIFEETATIAIFPIGTIFGFVEVAHGIRVAELGFAVVFGTCEVASFIVGEGGLASH